MKPAVDSGAPRALRRPLDPAPTSPERVATITTPPRRWALCILCGGPTETLVVIAAYESASNSGALKGCGYCAELLGKRVAA